MSQYFSDLLVGQNGTIEIAFEHCRKRVSTRPRRRLRSESPSAQQAPVESRAKMAASWPPDRLLAGCGHST